MASPTTKFNQLPRIIFLMLGVLVIFVSSHLLRQCAQKPAPTSHVSKYQRIIALAPSSVEIIYQLGLEDRLVGVSRFCHYPPEAASKPVVGGYLDLDFESVLRLKPDCVILLDEQHLLAKRLQQLNIKTISVDHASTGGIIHSIHVIGETLDKSTEAKTITNSLRNRILAVEKNSSHINPKPRVLVCISRDTTANHPDRIIASGNAGVHQEYITIAGGENAYQGAIAYPSISREKLIQMDPDIIIDLVTEDTWNQTGEKKLLSQWSTYAELKAVQNKRIIFIHENKHLIPGPRFTDTLEVFAQAINPK